VDTEQFALHARIEEQHWWFLGRRTILRRLLEQAVPPSCQALVADVGCGTGGNATLADGYRYVGIDPSAEAIDWARQRFPGREFLCGWAPEALEPRMAEVDVLLLSDVLEHVPDDFEIFSKLVAGLRRGAHVLLTVPADPALWSPHDVSFGHFRRYDRPRLERVWSGLPMSCRLVSYFMARLYPVVRCVRAVTSWRGRTGGQARTDFRLPWRPVNRLLEGLLAGESRSVLAALDRPTGGGYSRGVSLVALLRREPGDVAVRKKPDDVPPDLHDPRSP
jgi:SAM-dependent methyltransferase